MNQSDLTMDVSNQDYQLIITLRQTKTNNLKWHVFGHNAGSAFCYVFGMSVTYEFHTIFLLDSLEALSCFRCRLFCIKGIF